MRRVWRERRLAQCGEFELGTLCLGGRALNFGRRAYEVEQQVGRDAHVVLPAREEVVLLHLTRDDEAVLVGERARDKARAAVRRLLLRHRVLPDAEPQRPRTLVVEHLGEVVPLGLGAPAGDDDQAQIHAQCTSLHAQAGEMHTGRTPPMINLKIRSMYTNQSKQRLVWFASAVLTNVILIARQK
eukprot:6178185-Pleurochrysis_carterae.AAC.4